MTVTPGSPIGKMVGLGTRNHGVARTTAEVVRLWWLRHLSLTIARQAWATWDWDGRQERSFGAVPNIPLVARQRFHTIAMLASPTGNQVGQTAKSTGAAPIPTEAVTSQHPSRMIVMLAIPTGKQVGRKARKIGAAHTSTGAVLQSRLACLMIVMLASPTGKQVGQKAKGTGAANTSTEAALSPNRMIVMLAMPTGTKVGQIPRSIGVALTTTELASSPPPWLLLAAASSGVIPTSSLLTTPSMSSTERATSGS